jgi:hypothetical protein
MSKWVVGGREKVVEKRGKRGVEDRRGVKEG